MIFWQCIFWISVFLIFHSYILFPWLLKLLAGNKQLENKKYEKEEYPPVSILMAAYNEERVIRQKIESVFSSSYPKSKITMLVGSDNSSDKTNEILNELEKKYKGLKAIYFKQRTGKPEIINQLVDKASDELLIMTDANVMFKKDSIPKLIRHFKEESIGCVGGNTINEDVSSDGVSIQEKAFNSREIRIKHREGILWNATIGVYGGLYAIRKNLYTKVPPGFAVDDFFISMCVLRKKKSVIMDIEALSIEDLPNLMSEEYRRKVRIGTGNYYNLGYFRRELLRPWTGMSFAYISHKVIRWLAPFIFLAFMLSNIFLYNFQIFYNYALYLLIGILSLPIIDFFLSKIGIHIVFLRFIRHFITMNIAFLQGFINYIGGKRKDVWQPTNR